LYEPSITLRCKRLLDIFLGTVLALLALPVILVLACGVAVTLREWPFFVQHRIGKDGRTIAFPKLRTLPRNVPKYALKYEWDVELGRFAQFLRKRHLDELPQLLVVPIGWMSLVGPRPKLPDFVEPVDDYYYWTRTSISQGCTGLWQIGMDTHRLPGEAPEYDFFYVENVSVRLDMWILWRTALTLLGFARPTGLSEIPAWTRRGVARSAAARATASVLADDREIAPELS
jgi:lipopolysaccharide/colanic/teichoic acid biosynthesis glycosyltransferase